MISSKNLDQFLIILPIFVFEQKKNIIQITISRISGKKFLTKLSTYLTEIGGNFNG